MASTIRNTVVSWGMSSFPVALRKASEKQDVKFDRAIKTDEGYERIERQEVGASSGVSTSRGSAPVIANGDMPVIVHGVWISDEDFREVPAEALEAVVETTQLEGIEIEEFIPLKDVPWERIEGMYYLAPHKGLIGAKPLKMLRDAMKAEKVAAEVKLCLKGTNGRQKLAIVRESHGKVVVNLMAFADDVRDADESASAIENVEINREHLKVARQLVKAMTIEAGKVPFIDQAKDDAIAERERLYSEAVDGKPVKAPMPRVRQTSQTDDLLAQLRASVEAQRERVTA